MSEIADKVFWNKNMNIIQEIATSSNYPVCMVRSIIRRTLHNCNKSMLITENETKIPYMSAFRITHKSVTN